MTGLSAFEKVNLSYEKLSYVKLARVNALTSKLDNFLWAPDLKLRNASMLRANYFSLQWLPD